MKYTLVLIVLTGLTAGRAHAGDEGWAALGGFVIGAITGAVIADDDDDSHRGPAVDHRVHDRYDRGHDCDRGCNECYRGRDYHKKGHGHIKHSRVWVPGRWVIVINNCGDRVRVWKRGHYVNRPDRHPVARYDRYERSRYCD